MCVCIINIESTETRYICVCVFVLYYMEHGDSITHPPSHHHHHPQQPTKQKEEPYVYAGHILQAHGPIRDPASKWHLPTALYAPARFPTYAEGPLYVLSQVNARVYICVFMGCMHLPLRGDKMTVTLISSHFTRNFTNVHTAPRSRPPLPHEGGRRRSAQHLLRDAPARGLVPLRGRVYRCVSGGDKYVYVYMCVCMIYVWTALMACRSQPLSSTHPLK